MGGVADHLRGKVKRNQVDTEIWNWAVVNEDTKLIVAWGEERLWLDAMLACIEATGALRGTWLYGRDTPAWLLREGEER